MALMDLKAASFSSNNTLRLILQIILAHVFFKIPPDDGDSSDAALLQLWRAGQQPDVQPVWGGGHPGLLLCTLAKQEGGGPRRAGHRPGHLLHRLYLVPRLPLQPSRC